MIKKIVMTMDFEKAKSKAANIVKEMTLNLYTGKDFAKIIKSRIQRSQNYRGDTLFPLKTSTLNIRKMRGRSSTKPLIETGKLLNSVKNVKRKNKIGFSMMKYGMHQAKGFVTNNKFAVKNNNKIVGWRDYSDGIRVLPRPFVYPLSGQIKKTHISSEPFVGMIEINKNDVKKVIKNLKKALRHKKVIRIK